MSFEHRSTVLKTVFELKSGVELFRIRGGAKPTWYTNKLGYDVEGVEPTIEGAQIETTADLAALLAKPLASEIAALGYSDFILRWQNYFSDIPYCVVLHPHRSSKEDDQLSAAQLTQLKELLKPKINQPKIKKKSVNIFEIQRTIGVAEKKNNELVCGIYTAVENIKKNGEYKIVCKKNIHEETVKNSDWNNLPLWFPSK